jgi:hypothetical protein
MVWLPDRVPLVFPLLGIVTSASGEQLTGRSLPKKKITGWAGSELHCTIEAREPGENPVPATWTTSPPAKPLQMGSAGLLLLHVTPGAVLVRDRVVVAAALTATSLIATMALPLSTRSAPSVESNGISRRRTTRLEPMGVMADPHPPRGERFLDANRPGPDPRARFKCTSRFEGNLLFA